jgi:cytohesin
MITSKTRILSCILGIILTIGVCEGAQYSDMEVQVDNDDFATFAYKDEWFKLVKDSPDSDEKSVDRIITLIIKEGIDVNITDENGNSALYYAVTKNKPNLLKALLKCEKLKVNLPLIVNGFTALHFAVSQKDRLETLECLLQHKGIDIYVLRSCMNDDYKESALSLAIEKGNIEAVNLLIKKEPDIVNRAVNAGGMTALCKAVLSGSAGEDMVKVLLDAGADVDIINPYNEKKTVIEVAEKVSKVNPHLSLLKAKIALLRAAELQKKSKQAGAQPSLQEKWFKAISDNNTNEVCRLIDTPGIDINATDNSSLKATALHIAAMDPQKAGIAKLLIEKPATDVNTVNLSGKTPLFEAINKNNAEIANLLLTHEKINLEVCDKSCMTLFYTAVLSGHLPMVELLSKDKRIKIDSPDERFFNATPLHVAVERKKTDIVDFLLKNSPVDVWAHGSKGETPLYLAMRISTLEVVKTILFYLENKKIKLSNQNYRDLMHIINGRGVLKATDLKEWNKTILEHVLVERIAPYSKKDQLEWRDAVQHNNFVKMEELIKKGADINLLCFPSGTALHDAVFRNDIEKINFLLKNGADINIYDPLLLHTPLWIAVKMGNKKILEILLKHPEADINDPQDALLYEAVARGLENIVELLLSQKETNVNLISVGGWTALHKAAIEENGKIAKLLLGQDVIDVNAANGEKDTPLDIAVQRSNIEITLLLLEKIKEKKSKISTATYEKIKGDQSLYGNDEIRSLADELKQGAATADQ